MANINTTAQVDLIVNGKSAAEAMQKIEQRAVELRKKMDQCTIKGDIKGAQRIQRQLESLDRRYQRLRNSCSDFDRTMKNLDKASVKDLEAALRRLKSEFNSLERGSEAWNRQAELIRRVRQEINNANAALHTASTSTRSFSERAIDFFNKWQIAIMGVVGALSGLIMAGRKSVNAYAEMDEALADTMKFTGMSRDRVLDLNDAFKKMDTRTARETLNALAQEAGRLGKQTKEDVLGYVQAADIINVALSDLGEGATQKIAKLSNIFKIEDQYGTYESMLKIGSVVNVLSQNCTASKPYLVEFAGRLAGVGNQAHITLEKIIGLGAVLDANGQKVEASATAIGQVLTRMYRDPAKYARVAGLEVSNFTKLLKDDANEALLTFLDALGKAGDMNVLAPMFADMGENGARVINALSTLSKHIDEVRWQQDNANKAFTEGTSVLHEYQIFNNTAQAGIDKARKRITELSIELGEKLMPVMRHIYTSGSLFLRALSTIVDFIAGHGTELAMLTAAVIVYTVAVKAAALNTWHLTAATKTWTVITKLMQPALTVVKLALVAAYNGLQYFTNGLQ
ncbi:MAG: phage tail tape measure protein, partial [Muribaculaceae bacterium]|nr:phage tail tape measure protein [Muribaculaceae bacterium]